MSSLRQKVQVVLLWLSPDNKCQLLRLKTNANRGGFWQNVTGGVEAGESLSTAASRELQEETGLLVSKLIEMHQTFDFVDQYGKSCQESVYLAIIRQSTPPSIIISSEHIEYDFYAIERVKRDDFGYNSNYEAFSQAVSYITKSDDDL
ncbi:MAG: NUDIX domain-containing protein [Bdellovibrionales bacterium]|jgi:8-oxo-dGTP pyrophosphatase MutT (NUDIX family)|nr:NUDIX domain-containing protein [Bdellovibrionales bacterium]MBT3527062.1 NUDIX domain-containing protein [Bdellovibrionales bacterium]MBT7668721.1 NUDIX domain-containing protein [Bdellovibrionales bacterium]